MFQADLRPATSADLGALVALERAAFGAEALSAVSLRQYVDLGGPAFIVAMGPGPGLLGYAAGGLRLGRPRQGWLLSVVVAPEARGRGLGRLLTDAVLQALQAGTAGVGGVERVWATAAPDNGASRRMLAGLGFQEVACEDDYFGPGAARILLCWPAPG